jgi:DNA-directed RNA polymerase subunit RPC12/RpoP
MNELSFWQKFFKALASRDLFTAMETESRRWMVQCEHCRHERSIWELGGIRWKAKGTRRMFHACPNCGQKRWHMVYKNQA